jgi:asparagine synthase (glutamine-hydrolysing)
VSRLEARLYLGNTLLHVGDTSGMAHGLEIRVPMLDQRIIDLVFALPGEVRLPAARADKHLLRTAFADLLPAAVTGHAKRGFVLPLGAWMRGPLREYCEGALDTLRRDGLLRADGVNDVWNAFLREPESPAWSRAWTLCVLGSWLMHTRTPLVHPQKAAHA